MGLRGASVLTALLLTACAGQPFAAEPPPGVSMVGRWTLRAPDAPSCGMKFDGAAGEKHGAIEPDGGCPGKFFMSRSWQMAKGRLTIDDYKDRPLAKLTLAGRRFSGTSANGLPVTLAR